MSLLLAFLSSLLPLQSNNCRLGECQINYCGGHTKKDPCRSFEGIPLHVNRWVAWRQILFTTGKWQNCWQQWLTQWFSTQYDSVLRVQTCSDIWRNLSFTSHRWKLSRCHETYHNFHNLILVSKRLSNRIWSSFSSHPIRYGLHLQCAKDLATWLDKSAKLHQAAWPLPDHSRIKTWPYETFDTVTGLTNQDSRGRLTKHCNNLQDWHTHTHCIAWTRARTNTCMLTLHT